MKSKKIGFTKMHGAGNDYIYIDCMKETPSDPAELSRKVSDRHFGVGSDGLVLILPSDIADFRMRMFNADGSEAQMCGNASRCIGKYLYEEGLTSHHEIRLETLAGIKILHLHVDSDNKVDKVTVDMGAPELTPSKIPALSASSMIKLSEEETIAGTTYRITAVSMGNPHAVIFTDKISDELVTECGPLLECAPIFPEKANIEFVKVASPDMLEMRVWERGSGETMACGTGACASTVAAVLNGYARRRVTISLRGGLLEVEWNEADNHVYLTGGAEYIAKGEFYY